MALLISYVVGGLALFLYGMKLATEGLRDAAGGRLRATLTVLTARRSTGVLAGIVVTFLVSSSSAIAVMLVELANGGLLSLGQAVLVLLGAGVGIALTVEIITFPVSSYALFLVALGFLVNLFARFRRGKALGSALLGVGLVFFGLDLINQGVGSAAKETVASLGGGLEYPLLGFTVGLLVSALIRSAATVGVAVVLAGHGVALVPLIPVVLGAMVGTCSAPLLASIKGSRKGRQVAVAELVFRLVIAGVFMLLIAPTAEFMTWVTQHTGMETRRSVANTMLFVSIVTVIAIMPLTALLVKVVERLVGRAEMVPAGSLQFINFEKTLEPDEALAQAHKEVIRMAGITRDMVARSVKAVIDNDEREMERLGLEDEKVDVVDKVLSQYLGSLNPAGLSPEALEVKSKLLYIVKDVEEMADLATRELTRIGWEKSRDNVEFADEQKREIEEIMRIVDEDLDRLVIAVKGEDRSDAVRITLLERDWDLDLRRMRLFEQQFARISAGAPGAEESSESYMNTINILRTVHFLITDIVRMISEPPVGRQSPGSSDAEPETKQA